MTRLYVGLMLAGGCVTAVACFSDRSAGPGVSGECRVPVTVIDSTHFIVAIRSFAFHPDSLAVPAGSTVTWVDCEDAGTAPHTTTSETAVWNSPNLTTGGRFSHTFATTGSFGYYCAVHPYMLGKIVAQ